MPLSGSGRDRVELSRRGQLLELLAFCVAGGASLGLCIGIGYAIGWLIFTAIVGV